MDLDLIKSRIRDQFYDLSLHAHQERQVEKIKVKDIEQAILNGDIIEQYPDDPRGASCLVIGFVQNKPVHAVCGFRADKLLIVTVYRPKLPVWKDYKTRVKELKSRV